MQCQPSVRERNMRASRVLGGEDRTRFCSSSSLNLLHLGDRAEQTLTQGQSCLQRSLVKQILSKVVGTHFQHGVEHLDLTGC